MLCTLKRSQIPTSTHGKATSVRPTVTPPRGSAHAVGAKKSLVGPTSTGEDSDDL